MTTAWYKNGIVILLIIASLYIIFLRECKTSTKCIQDDEMVIKKSVWDSINAVADLKPEYKTDTVYISGKTIYKYISTPTGTVNPVDSSIRDYKDSLVNKEIAVWLDMQIKGEVKTVAWAYKPIETRITNEIKVYVPKIVNNPINVPVNGFYASFSLGLAPKHVDMPIFGLSLDYSSKNNMIYGLGYQRLGEINVYSVKMGVRLFR